MAELDKRDSLAVYPKISVIVPAYNMQDYLGECLDSLQKQTEKDFEVLVVDDGSADETPETAARFAGSDPRFLLIRKENGGVSSARNTALRKAKGEWITFVDADDTVSPEYLEKLLAAAKTAASFEGLSEKNRSAAKAQDPSPIDLVAAWPGEKERILTGQEEMTCFFCKAGYSWGKLIRRDLLTRSLTQEKLRDLSEPTEKTPKDSDRSLQLFHEGVHFAEDFLFYLELLPRVRRMKITGDAGYHYRVREGSLSAKYGEGGHTRREFESKYTFAAAWPLVYKAASALSKPAAEEAINHCCYSWSLFLLLDWNLKQEEISADPKYRDQAGQIRKLLFQYYGVFFRVTLLKHKNIKRFLLGTALGLFPNAGGRLADRCLRK